MIKKQKQKLIKIETIQRLNLSKNQLFEKKDKKEEINEMDRSVAQPNERKKGHELTETRKNNTTTDPKEIHQRVTGLSSEKLLALDGN